MLVSQIASSESRHTGVVEFKLVVVVQFGSSKVSLIVLVAARSIERHTYFIVDVDNSIVVLWRHGI